jgi:hypothetical protein
MGGLTVKRTWARAGVGPFFGMADGPGEDLFCASDGQAVRAEPTAPLLGDTFAPPRALSRAIPGIEFRTIAVFKGWLASST